MLVFLMAYTDVSLPGFVSDAVHAIRRKHHVAPPGKVVHTAFELRNQGFPIDRIKIDQLITSDLDLIGAMGVVGQILWLLWRPQALWIRRPEQGATSGPKP